MATDVTQLLNQLTLTQLTAQALAMQCAQMIAEVKAAVEPPPPPVVLPPAPDPPVPPVSAECAHPENARDYTARTMGRPNQFLCRMCGRMVNPQPQE